MTPDEPTPPRRPLWAGQRPTPGEKHGLILFQPDNDICSGWIRRTKGKIDGRKNSWEWNLSIAGRQRTWRSGLADNQRDAKKLLIGAWITFLGDLTARALEELEESMGQT